jgi:sulfur transfer protein SufE
MHTAEFVSFIDSLFDSLNGSQLRPSEGKNLQCALSKDSKSGQLRTNFKFVEGWEITIRAIMHLWQNLKGLQYLSLRNLNQDPVENLFSQVRQHGVCNTNPTCHQFVAALKTVIINNFILLFLEVITGRKITANLGVIFAYF